MTNSPPVSMIVVLNADGIVIGDYDNQYDALDAARNMAADCDDPTNGYTACALDSKWQITDTDWQSDFMCSEWHQTIHGPERKESM